MILIAIDPGLDGGLALALLPGPDRAEEVVKAYPMPTRPHFTGRGREVDACGIRDRIHAFRADYTALGGGTVGLVVIEQVGHTPIKKKGEVRQNPKSMFTFGDGFGLMRAVVALECWPVEYLLPQKWQAMVLPAALRGTGKKGSISYARRRYPQISLLASDLCRTPHDGMAEALCLLESCRRMFGGAAERPSLAATE